MSQKFLSKTLINNQNAYLIRCYYTNRTNKPSLYSKISPLGDPGKSVVPELDNWIDNGNKVRVAELQRIIRDLRKRKRFSQALEVSDWMNKRDICIFSPTEHAVHLDLIGRVHGVLSAEDYFNNLRALDRTDRTYGALLNCYVRQRQIEKSISHFEKMKNMGFATSALTYNDIMCLYTNIGQYEEIPEVLSEMIRNKVSPDNYTYRICINAYGFRSDVEGMEKILLEMEVKEQEERFLIDWNTYAVVANIYIKAGKADEALKALHKSEDRLDNKDGTGYNHLITLYASLGRRDDVLRLWSLEKSSCNRYLNRDYITMLQSLVKLDEFGEAEKILKEWESSGNCYDVRIANIIVIGYTSKGLYEKAEALLENMMKKGKATTPNSWSTVATGYFDKGDIGRAYNCMKAALSSHMGGKGWKPNSTVIAGILSWLENKGNNKDADTFLTSLWSVAHTDKQMYNTLLKVNTESTDTVSEPLKNVKTDRIGEDEETKKS